MKKLSQMLQSNSSLASTSNSSVPTTDSKGRVCTLESKEVDSIIKGLTFATLSIIEDDEGAKRPYQLEAIKQIVGSNEEASKGLNELLENSFGMQLDCRIDVRGSSESGYPLGVQGYIAHNDKTIVLSYKLQKTVFQFLEDMDSTSTDWDIHRHTSSTSSAGLLVDQFMSMCSNVGGFLKPGVHTGFYQNFLATLPLIKAHINPLLTPDQPRRSLFVVGHSIGAGVATLAACYFLLEFDWANIPHRLVNVTGGSPRSCSQHMKAMIDERRKTYEDSVRLFRVIQEDDIVPLMPSSNYGFQHVFPYVSIDEKGNITKQGDPPIVPSSSFRTDGGVNGTTASITEDKGKKDRVARSPKSLRSHTHNSYMEPFLRVKGVNTVAELRLKALAPFSLHPIKPASDSSTKKKSSYPNTPRIKSAPMANSNSANGNKSGSWWKNKSKSRKPTGNNKTQKASNNKSKKAVEVEKTYGPDDMQEKSGSVALSEDFSSEPSTSPGIVLHTSKPPSNKRNQRGIVVVGR